MPEENAQNEEYETIPLDISHLTEGKTFTMSWPPEPIWSISSIDEAKLAKTGKKLLELADRWLALADRLDSDALPEILPTRPFQKLNGRKIAEALPCEAVFTTAKHKKHIVATYGCSASIAVGGYDSVNKIAFIVHFARTREVVECGGKIHQNIDRIAKKKITTPIQLHLRGGIKDCSEEVIQAIKVWMTMRSDLPMKIVSEDILSNGVRKSLLINAKTGKPSEYHPLRNPQARKITTVILKRVIRGAYIPNIRVAFRPKVKDI